jgi:hypothetical protein
VTDVNERLQAWANTLEEWNPQHVRAITDVIVEMRDLASTPPVTSPVTPSWYEGAVTKRFRRWLRAWLDCRRHRCTYYQHYLVHGPADLTHEGYHNAEHQAERHFAGCTYAGYFGRDGKLHHCPNCLAWERRVRA